MVKNYDLFGNEVEVTDLPKGRRKTPTMQEMYGLTDGRTCGECTHCVAHEANRRWYKCKLWLRFFPGGGNSAATDIRLKNMACGKFEEET